MTNDGLPGRSAERPDNPHSAFRIPQSKQSAIRLLPSALLAGLASIAAFLGGEALRFSLLGGAAWGLAFAFVVSLEAGMLGLLVFEPLRGVLRRAQYLLVDYTPTDPIHLVSPLVMGVGFLLLLRREGWGVWRATPVAGPVTALAAVFALEIFNPLQSSVLVGFTGALFMLVPLFWFYFGQAAQEDFMWRAARVVVVLGIAASLYGVYQLAFGFPSFEQYWLDHTEFYESIAVYNVKRALATFSSAEEWGRYVQFGAVLAAGLGLAARERAKALAWYLAAAVLLAMLVLTGQRTSLFGLLLGWGVLWLTGPRSWPKALARLALAALPLALAVVFLQPASQENIFDKDESETFSTMVSHTTKGAVNPTGEGSLYERFDTWTYLVTEVLPYRPLGVGLGETALGGLRFGGDGQNSNRRPIDSYLITLAVACGPLGAILFVWLLARATRLAKRRWQTTAPHTPDDALWRTMLAMLAMFWLNNFFGNSFSMYSTAPIGWLTLGWISRNAATTEDWSARRPRLQ
jgi:hypothetical protein